MRDFAGEIWIATESIRSLPEDCRADRLARVETAVEQHRQAHADAGSASAREDADAEMSLMMMYLLFDAEAAERESRCPDA